MIDVLNLMVEELIKEDLTVDELKSLTTEISKHSGLMDSLRSHPVIDFGCIEMPSGHSQPRSVV